MKEELIIIKNIRKTINFIEKTVYNFPNEYKILKDRIINSCYIILENAYRANITQEVKYKYEILTQLKMLNFFFKQALDLKLISTKKFTSYGRYLLEIHKMVDSWCMYEKSK